MLQLCPAPARCPAVACLLLCSLAAARALPACTSPPTAAPAAAFACCALQSLAQNIAEAYYRLEPFLRAAVRSFVRQHLDTFAENEDGTDKQVGGVGGPCRPAARSMAWQAGSEA